MENRTIEAASLETQLKQLLSKKGFGEKDYPKAREILGKLAENKNLQFLSAVLQSDFQLVQKLFSEGVELTGPIIKDLTMLRLAVLVNNPASVSYIYKFKEDNLSKIEKLYDAAPAFLDAVGYNFPDCVSVLLECGIDANDVLLRLPNGDNPLIIAIKQEHISMYEKLIVGGADIDTEHANMPSARQYMEKYLAPNEHRNYIEIFEKQKIVKAKKELDSGNKYKKLIQGFTATRVDGTVAAGQGSISEPMDLKLISYSCQGSIFSPLSWMRNG